MGLLTCLFLAPVGAGAGVLALTRASEPAVLPAAVVMNQRTDDQGVIAAEFAQRVVLTWLGTTVGSTRGLHDLVGDTNGAVVVSREPFTIDDPAVAGVLQIDQNTWSVTIAATVSDSRPNPVAPASRRYYQVPIQVSPEGGVSALTLPAPVAPPQIVPAATTDAYVVAVSRTSPLGLSVEEFLSAYLTGTGEVSRYLTPGVVLNALTPAPYTSVDLDDLRADTASEPAPHEGDRMRVLATASAVVTETQSSVVSYALTLTARGGRWEVTGIDAAPVRPAPTAPAAGQDSTS